MNKTQELPEEYKDDPSSRQFSFTYLTSPLLEDERLDVYDKATAFGIAYYVDKSPVIWPGKKAIAKIASISERKVQECIKKLEECGYLTVERRRDPNNPAKNLSNLYTMHYLPRQSYAP